MDFSQQAEPRFFPGACVFCTSSSGPVAECGRDLDYFGQVYVCAKCVRDMAGVFGFLSPEQAESLRVELEEERALRSVLEDSLEKAKASRVVPLAEVAEMMMAKHGPAYVTANVVGKYAQPGSTT